MATCITYSNNTALSTATLQRTQLQTLQCGSVVVAVDHTAAAVRPESKASLCSKAALPAQHPLRPSPTL